MEDGPLLRQAGGAGGGRPRSVGRPDPVRQGAGDAGRPQNPDLHAFCEKLLRRFPLEAGVSPGFTVLEEVAAREVSAQAREERGGGVAERARRSDRPRLRLRFGRARLRPASTTCSRRSRPSGGRSTPTSKIAPRPTAARFADIWRVAISHATAVETMEAEAVGGWAGGPGARAPRRCWPARRRPTRGRRGHAGISGTQVLRRGLGGVLDPEGRARARIATARGRPGGRRLDEPDPVRAEPGPGADQGRADRPRHRPCAHPRPRHARAVRGRQGGAGGRWISAT